MSYYMTWGYLGYRKQIPWYLFFRRWVANKLVKAIAAVKGRSNKSLKGKWHTLWRGKTVYILSDITTMFKRVFSCFWRRVTVNWDWGEKHIELTNVRWCPCVSSKVESWTMATEGRAEQKDKWHQFTCQHKRNNLTRLFVLYFCKKPRTFLSEPSVKTQGSVTTLLTDCECCADGILQGGKRADRPVNLWFLNWARM